MNEKMQKVQKMVEAMADVVGKEKMKEFGESLLVNVLTQKGAPDDAVIDTVMLMRALQQLSEGYATQMTMAEMRDRLDLVELALPIGEAIESLQTELVAALTKYLGANADMIRAVADRAREVSSKAYALRDKLRAKEQDRAAEAQRVVREAIDKAK